VILASYHVGRYLGIRLRREFDSFGNEFGFELGKVLDDPIVDKRELATVREVRVGVDVVRCTVGRPACVPDTRMTVIERIGDEFVPQSLKLS
jgi:hypothetical protein